MFTPELFSVFADFIHECAGPRYQRGSVRSSLPLPPLLTEPLSEAVVLLLVPRRRRLQVENPPAAGVQAHVLVHPAAGGCFYGAGGVGRGGGEEAVGRSRRFLRGWDLHGGGACSQRL